MSTSELFVTANLEKGQKPSTTPWLVAALERRPAIIFVQEFGDRTQLEALAAEHGYRVVWPLVMSSRYWIVSSLMVREDLRWETVEGSRVDLLRVFDSYVAAAHVTIPGIGRLLAISVHASPNVASAQALAAWPGPLPAPRHGGEGVASSGHFFYSDLVVESLRQLSLDGPVLAAGDFNEARRWDDVNFGHTWGAEYFASIAADLVDVTWALWSQERRTRFHETHPAYQLDRVIASPDVATLILDAQVDSGWAGSEMAQKSDHAPVWFST